MAVGIRFPNDGDVYAHSRATDTGNEGRFGIALGGLAGWGSAESPLEFETLGQFARLRRRGWLLHAGFMAMGSGHVRTVDMRVYS